MDPHPYTDPFGHAVNYPHASQRVPIPGPNAPNPNLSGPIIIQDFQLIDNLAHLGRERIPERLVHAKGAGAHGYFKVTTDYASRITSQPIFHTLDVEIPVTVRFSTVAGELGSADTARDTQGFAVKLNTNQGIWDWVFLNTPTFFIRDPAKYPDLVHATKRNPQTNLKDPDMFWDYFSQNPETIHQLMMIFSDRGTPNGFHRQNGFGVNTYVFSKDNGEFYYVKIHLILSDGKKVQTLTASEATRLAGTDPDYSTRELFNDIKAGEFPKWDIFIQVMTPEQAMSEQWRYFVFDVTKIWPHRHFHLHKIGELVLNRNPENFFDEIEQLAFAPAHLIPYIEPTPDPLLQARLFIYPDTQRYRLGVNHGQLPCNAPKAPVANHQRAGAASFISQGSRPNYQSSTDSLKFVGLRDAIDSQIRNNMRHEIFHGSAYRDFLLPSDYAERDFIQPRSLWYIFNDAEKQAFVDNVAEALGAVTRDDIKYSQLLVFNAVDKDLAVFIASAINFNFVPPENANPALIERLKIIKKDIIPGGPS
ncbi:hypothetical protein AX15_003522 [Amanita polypyramis BW_CC]|nr:hypothetical protein AX15_003522 [Amanita polypyramis BW_CC]